MSTSKEANLPWQEKGGGFQRLKRRRSLKQWHSSSKESLDGIFVVIFGDFLLIWAHGLSVVDVWMLVSMYNNSCVASCWWSQSIFDEISMARITHVTIMHDSNLTTTTTMMVVISFLRRLILRVSQAMLRE
jgi:hypothetical protein